MNGLKTTPVHTKIGPVTFPKGTGEGDLDVEWLMGMAPGYVLLTLTLLLVVLRVRARMADCE